MLRFSLRQLLTLAVVIGVVLTSLRTGGLLASAVQTIGLVVFVVFAINALVGHGETKVFAIGFLIPSLLYVLMLAFSGAELDPYDRVLPTSTILRMMHEQLVVRTYSDMQGNVVTDYDPTRYQVVASEFGGGGTYLDGFPSPKYPANAVIMHERQDRRTFMLIGHGLIAALCACLGGKYAVYASRRKG